MPKSKPKSKPKSHKPNQKVVCVTGSAKRIGAAIVKAFHQDGYQVIIHCHNSLKQANALAHSLNKKRADSAKVIVFNLMDIDDIEHLKNDILACFGRLDVLVHNASRFYPTPVTKTSIQQWDELFASNAKAPFFLTQQLKEALTTSNGCVVSLLDIHAQDRPFKGYAVYNMAKSAHAMLVKSLAIELAPDIRVNGVAPGANIWPEAGTDQVIADSVQQKIALNIPLRKLGKPEDIADAVLFLAKAPYVTGHVINVDGGRSLTLAGS